MADTIVLRCPQAPFIRFVPGQAPAILGRSAGCAFVVQDTTISRKHAEIRLLPGGVHVTDLDSRNGTFVDDQRVQQAEVRGGQLVRFGRVPFAVAVEKAALGTLSEETTDEPGPLPGTARTRTQCTLLTDAQRRVFEVLLTGMPEKRIARELGLSQHTIHNHIRALYRIFGVHSRAELLAAQLLPAPRP